MLTTMLTSTSRVHGRIVGHSKVTDTWSDSLAVQVYGDEITLTYGTGDDHSIFDVYINQTLYNSYDGYSASNGEQSINVELGYEGLHLVEVKNRHEQNRASSGYRIALQKRWWLKGMRRFNSRLLMITMRLNV